MTTESKRRKAPLAPGEVDAIGLLTADHLAVKTMFKKFASLKESGSAPDKLALVQQICSALTIHAQIEEELFYPAVRKAIDEEDLMDEADVEHAGMKALIAQLTRARPSDDHFDAKVTVLGELVEHHVKEEEKQMFPPAKKAIDSRALGLALEARKAELEATGLIQPNNNQSEPVNGRQANP